jgi:hypothetical protein
LIYFNYKNYAKWFFKTAFARLKSETVGRELEAVRGVTGRKTT